LKAGFGREAAANGSIIYLASARRKADLGAPVRTFEENEEQLIPKASAGFDNVKRQERACRKCVMVQRKRLLGVG
jgi:hypothetical protein